MGKAAARLIPCHASSAAAERANSAWGSTYSAERSSLSRETADKLVHTRMSETRRRNSAKCEAERIFLRVLPVEEGRGYISKEMQAEAAVKLAVAKVAAEAKAAKAAKEAAKEAAKAADVATAAEEDESDEGQEGEEQGGVPGRGGGRGRGAGRGRGRGRGRTTPPAPLPPSPASRGRRRSKK